MKKFARGGHNYRAAVVRITGTANSDNQTFIVFADRPAVVTQIYASISPTNAPGFAFALTPPGALIESQRGFAVRANSPEIHCPNLTFLRPQPSDFRRPFFGEIAFLTAANSRRHEMPKVRTSSHVPHH
jgi:hypothetical protein